MIEEMLDGVKAGMADSVDTCKGCGSEESVEGVEVLPLDPIDHSVNYIPLCGDCREWAEERNDVAAEIGEKLRDSRAQLAEEYAGELESLPERPDGLQPGNRGVGELLEQ